MKKQLRDRRHSKKGLEDDRPQQRATKFSEEELAKFAKAFALSDLCTGATGAIPATEVMNTMRRLGQCPTQLEVNKVIVDVEILRRSKKHLVIEEEKECKRKKERKKPGGKGNIIVQPTVNISSVTLIF